MFFIYRSNYYFVTYLNRIQISEMMRSNLMMERSERRLLDEET